MQKLTSEGIGLSDYIGTNCPQVEMLSALLANKPRKNWVELLFQKKIFSLETRN